MELAEGSPNSHIYSPKKSLDNNIIALFWYNISTNLQYSTRTLYIGGFCRPEVHTHVCVENDSFLLLFLEQSKNRGKARLDSPVRFWGWVGNMWKFSHTHITKPKNVQADK
jgi:hypothetical protein